MSLRNNQSEYTQPEIVGEDTTNITKPPKKKEIDIAKSGPLNFSQLQQINDLDGISEETLNFLKRTYNSTPDYQSVPSYAEETTPFQSQLYNEKTGDYWGNSMFDEEDAIDISRIDDLADIRAENQPWYAKMGAGLGKMGILAVTTFVDGVGGTIVGLLNMGAEAASGNIHSGADLGKAFIMNPLSEGLQAINEASESWMPNYYTMNELQNDENGEWYKNVFTTNFWGDKFIKNVGFTIGAAAAAIVTSGAASKVFVSKGLREAFKGTVYKAAKEGGKKIALNEVDDVYKAVRNGEKLFTKNGELIKEGTKLSKDLQKAAEQLRRAEWRLKLTGSITSAMGEGRIEAIGAVKELQEKEYNNVNTWANNALEDIKNKMFREDKDSRWFIDDPELGIQLTPEGQAEFERRSKYINDKKNNLLYEASMKSSDIANYVFLSNVALLSFSNFVQFGRAMSGGFTTANNFKNLIKGVTKQEVKKEGGKEVLKETIKRLGEEGVEAAVNKGAIRRKVARAVANPFMEGFEEINQASITAGAGLQIGSELNEYARNYHTDLLYDSMFADSIDLEAQDYAVSYLNSLLDGAAKTYGKSQSWEEFSIGFLTGMLGIPKVGRKANGKKGLQMSGEFWEGIRDAKQMKQEAQELANAINTRINTPEMREYYKGLIRHTKGERDKLDFLMRDDQFDYNNSEFKQLISDAIMFDKAGRLEDFYAMIEDYSQLTGDEEESLRTIIANSKYNVTDENGNVQLDANGNPVQKSLYDGYSVKRMNEEVLKPRAEKAKKAVDFYVKNSNSLKALYGDNIDKQTLEEMVYNLSQLDNWTDRSREMMSEISRALHNDFRTVREAGANIEDIDEDLLKSMDDVREFFGKGDKNIINNLLRAIRQGKLSKDNFANAYEEIQKLKSHKKAVIDTARVKLNAIDAETVDNIERTLKSIETDSKVKETILNDILSLAKTPKDKIDLFNMDINLVQDFNEIIKEAIDTLGTRKVAEKLIDWKNFLNKTIVTAKFSQRKNGNGRILSVQEAVDNLYKSLYSSNTEEEEQAFKDKIEKELNEKGKEKKNAIKERALKSMRNLNDAIKDMNRRLQNISEVNSINYLKYKKMLDDLVLIQAAREVTLDKLKNLSEHPEWYTEASQKYLKEMQEKVNEQTSNLLKEKLNTCKTVQDIRALFENNDISDFNKQRELLEIALKDADENLRNLINEYLKIEKFKTVMMSVDSGTNESNAEESSNVILRVLDIIDTSQTLKEIFDRLEIGAFTKGMSKEEKEYAQGFLEKVFTAYNAFETTKKDKKEETSTEESGEKKSGSRLSRLVKEDAKTWEEGGSTSQKSNQNSNTPPDASPDDSSKAGAEAEETPADDDTMDEQSIKEYLEKLAGMEPDKKINSLKRKSIKKLEEIKKEADESTAKLIDAVIDSKPTEEYPNYTNNANSIEGKSMHYPENNTTGIVDKEKNNLEETVASNASRPVFDNWTYTIYNIYAAKRSLLQKLSIADEETRKKAEKYVSFMREYNAFRYINDGFLGLKYLKAKREGKEVPIHFIQIADDRTSYTKNNPKYPDEKHYTILQCVALTEAEVKELKDAWGEVKVIKNEYTVEGKKKVEYYQVVGSLHYSNNNFAAADLKKKDPSAYETYNKLRNESIPNKAKIASIQSELANPKTQENKTLVEALNKEIQILEMSDRWFAINSSFEGIRKDAIEKNEIDSNISIVEGVNDENKVANSMGTENSGPYIIKNSKMQSAIKTVYGGRLVKGTLASHLNPNDANDIKQAEWQPETNLKDIPVDESGTKLNGNTLLLGFYYGDGGLKIPQASAEDEVVPLRNNNHWAIASTGANGKLFNTAGSVWLMVRTADGKLYPKGLSVRRFNEKEYPKSKYFRKDASNPSTIMDIIYANAKVMVDPNASQTDKARAKVTISNLIYIPQKYSFGFNNDGKTVYISNKNGGYSRNIEIDVEAIKNADEESRYALINDYAEQLVDALHDEQFSFRFQVSPSKVKKDGDGTYRQLLLDSDVFITNLPILENIGGSFDTYPIEHSGKGWKIVKTEPEPENPNTSPAVPKSSSSMSNNVGIQYGETTFLVKEQDDTLLIIPNNAAKSSGKVQATPEEECAVRLMYNLNKGITSGEVVPGSGIYAMTGSDGKNYFFELDESNKLHVKPRKGTMEEIQEIANTKLQATKKVSQELNNESEDILNVMKETVDEENPEQINPVLDKEMEEINNIGFEELNQSTQPQQPVSNVPKSDEIKTETFTEEIRTSSSFNRLKGQTEEPVKTQKHRGPSREQVLSILDKAAQDKGYENYRELYNANKDTHPTLVSPDEEFSNPKELRKEIEGDCIPRKK